MIQAGAVLVESAEDVTPGGMAASGREEMSSGERRRLRALLLRSADGLRQLELLDAATDLDLRRFHLD